MFFVVENDSLFWKSCFGVRFVLSLSGLVGGVYIQGGEQENYPEPLAQFSNISQSLNNISLQLWVNIYCNI